MRALLEILSRSRPRSESFKTNEAQTARPRLAKTPSRGGRGGCGHIRTARVLMKAAERKDANPYSAKGMAKPTNFYCRAPDAQSVLLEGDFTGWAPLAMQRRVDGWWFVQVPITHGHHQYRFLVDGQAQLDPGATGVTRNEAHEKLSVIAVS